MTDAQTILRKLIKEIFADLKHQDVNITPLINGNCASSIYNIEVNHKNENLHLFAKISIIGDKMRNKINVDWLYKTERLVYTQLMKTFDDIQEKHDVPEEYRFEFPKFYGCNTNYGEETVVLENLDARGFKTYNKLKSLDWDHAAVAVTALARFHALSFAYEKEYPEEFKNLADKMKSQPFLNNNDAAVKEAWIKIIGKAIRVLKGECKGKMIHFLGTLPEEYDKFKMPISRTVLAHGDYKTCNLLFRTHNGKLETIVVDFQTLHSGSPVSDLLYLIFLGTDEQFRRDHYERLLDHYYQELSLASGRLMVDISEVYPRETFDSELKELLPHALRRSVVILPMVMMNLEDILQLKRDPDMTLFALNPNKLFAERFSGIVSDCVRWGAI